MNKFFMIGLFAVSVVVLPASALAHQPRIVEDNPTVVTLPEVSKAYYGTLSGEAAVYTIESDKPFALYVGLLVPDIAGQKTDVSAVILKNGGVLAELNGATFAWTKFFEPFGRDYYLQGPEYRAEAEAGTYEIRVSSPGSDNKYSLAIGEIEAFDFKETYNALTLIPQLKQDFFNKSPIDFILSPFGAGLIVVMFLLAFLFGFLYRYLLRKLAPASIRGVSQNIGTNDRWLRFAIGALLLMVAITTTWSPWLLFFAGLAFFEAIFSWCGLYAALGRNTCPA